MSLRPAEPHRAGCSPRSLGQGAAATRHASRYTAAPGAGDFGSLVRQRRARRMATADRVAPEAGKGVILVLAMPGQRSLARQKGQNLRRGDRVAGGIPIGISEEVPQEVRPGRELRAMGSPPERCIARSPRAASCQTLQIEGRHLAKCGEIDLGVDRGGGRVAVPEKVPDHLHRHALIQKMLGRGMPQGMRASRRPVTMPIPARRSRTILPRAFRPSGRIGARDVKKRLRPKPVGRTSRI